MPSACTPNAFTAKTNERRRSRKVSRWMRHPVVVADAIALGQRGPHGARRCPGADAHVQRVVGVPDAHFGVVLRRPPVDGAVRGELGEEGRRLPDGLGERAVDGDGIPHLGRHGGQRAGAPGKRLGHER
jgi:hypothetical protein